MSTALKVVMSYCVRWIVLAGVLLIAVVMPRGVRTQGNPDPVAFKFNSGQGVQPIFEGWAYNPDGSRSMYFGYINRNYVETPAIPIGPDNKLEPGAPDQGQPTVFGTRIHRQVFSVMVPKDWGKKELVWSVTVRGETERAVQAALKKKRLGFRKIASTLGVGVGTVQRINRGLG